MLDRSMENVNPEIITEILSWVPANSVVLQCTRVCKTWRTLILNPYFANLHGRHQLQLLNQQQQLDDDDGAAAAAAVAAKVGLGLLFWTGRFGVEGRIFQLHYRECYDNGIHNIIDDDEEQQQHSYSYKNKFLTKINHPHNDKIVCMNPLVGSCNGLICFTVRHHTYVEDPIYISNPITGEFVLLPQHPVTFYYTHIVSGFGYHPSTDQYKVVRLSYVYNPQQPMIDLRVVQVYTLGDGRGWRNIGEITNPLHPTPGITMDGAIHWMDADGKILAFDLGDEEFRLLPSPPCVSFGFFYHNTCFDIKVPYKLREFGSCLCVVHWDEEGESVNIWLFKKKKKNSSYDVKEQEDYYHSWSWIREFSIPRGSGLHMNQHQPFEPFTLTKSGEVLMRSSLNILCLYDPKTGAIKNLVDEDKGLSFFLAIHHMNSFVSLKALGENSMRIRKKSRRIRERYARDQKKQKKQKN